MLEQQIYVCQQPYLRLAVVCYTLPFKMKIRCTLILILKLRKR
jgi:hypothetical protein